MSKLYNNARDPSKKTLGTGYGNAEKARSTLEIIKPLPEIKQKQIVITMFNRAKFHKYRTKDMEKAMSIFSIWMKKRGIKHSKKKETIIEYCSGRGTTKPPCKRGGKKTKKIHNI